MRYVQVGEWLVEQLLNGPRLVREIEAAAAAININESALKRARRELGIKCWRDSNTPESRWWITLPNEVRQLKCPSEVVADLMEGIRARRDDRGCNLAEVVAWVSEHLRDELGMLDAKDVPNGRALAMLIWAKANERDFRTLYEAKLLSSRHQAGHSALKPRAKLKSGPVTDEAIQRLLDRQAG